MNLLSGFRKVCFDWNWLSSSDICRLWSISVGFGLSVCFLVSVGFGLSVCFLRYRSASVCQSVFCGIGRYRSSVLSACLSSSWLSVCWPSVLDYSSVSVRVGVSVLGCACVCMRLFCVYGCVSLWLTLVCTNAMLWQGEKTTRSRNTLSVERA